MRFFLFCLLAVVLLFVCFIGGGGGVLGFGFFYCFVAIMLQNLA